MRLIDADKIELFIKDGLNRKGEDAFGFDAVQILAEIECAPTVDVEPVKHGRWIEDGEFQICSECGEEHGWIEFRATYCDNCGAKMDEVSE